MLTTLDFGDPDPGPHWAYQAVHFALRLRARAGSFFIRVGPSVQNRQYSEMYNPTSIERNTDEAPGNYSWRVLMAGADVAIGNFWDINPDMYFGFDWFMWFYPLKTVYRGRGEPRNFAKDPWLYSGNGGSVGAFIGTRFP